jgi:hypothetical protein
VVRTRPPTESLFREHDGLGVEDRTNRAVAGLSFSLSLREKAKFLLFLRAGHLTDGILAAPDRDASRRGKVK